MCRVCIARRCNHGICFCVILRLNEVIQQMMYKRVQQKYTFLQCLIIAFQAVILSRKSNSNGFSYYGRSAGVK